MSEPIHFAKLSGSGNDFICIDNRDGRFDSLLADAQRVTRFARVCCRHGNGIGADGVIFVATNEMEGFADLAARHFEPDGSEAELCGNGVACFTRWVLDNKWVTDHEVRILTTAGVVRGKRLDDDYVRVCIPLPETLELGQELEVDGRRWQYDYAVTGVPHLVTYVDDLDKIEMPHWGPRLRYHERFAPRGVNANFVQVLGEGRLAIRTWEFGVEDETLACGTGSAAAAILTAKRLGWGEKYLRGEAPVELKVRSGDTVRVYFTLKNDGAVSDLCLETIVRFVFLGEFHEELVESLTGGE